MNAVERRNKVIQNTLEGIKSARESLDRFEQLLKDESRADMLESSQIGLVLLTASIDEDEDPCISGHLVGSNTFVNKALKLAIKEA